MKKPNKKVELKTQRLTKGTVQSSVGSTKSKEGDSSRDVPVVINPRLLPDVIG